ncbi:MAG: hypothetical protein E7616_00990 [Ruminococcaceae bacterium]|nr:hypothetical protein [Oscillospiraceae bacterium]
MKKAISIFLGMMMILSIVSVGAFTASAETDTLIAAGSEWNYYAAIGNETLPENWYTTGFDVSAWTKASAPFGNKWSSGHATDIDQGDADLQVAFVKTFEVTEDPASYEAVTLGFYYDENPVVYLNGQEVTRLSGYNTSLDIFDVTEMKNLLVKGTNTIAVLMLNASTGYGFNFDMSLTAGSAPEPPPAVKEDGTIEFKEITKTGFYDFGSVNNVKNLIDGDVGSCSGSGRNPDVEQYFTFTFWEELEVQKIYLQCKGVEDGKETSNEDGITFGYYDIYVDDTLVGDNVPAVSEVDGGYTLVLETPVKGTTLKVEIVDEWYADNWANLADIVVWNDASIIGDPTGVTLNKTGLNLKVGESDTLTATIAPEGAAANLVWETSGDSIATVDENGKVTAKGVGTAIITVYDALEGGERGVSASCVVLVTAAEDPTPGEQPTTEPGDTTTEPGEQPTTEPGEQPTTEPGNTTTDDAEEEGGLPTGALIAIIAALVVVAGGAIFFILKKK